MPTYHKLLIIKHLHDKYQNHKHSDFCNIDRIVWLYDPSIILNNMFANVHINEIGSCSHNRIHKTRSFETWQMIPSYVSYDNHEHDTSMSTPVNSETLVQWIVSLHSVQPIFVNIGSLRIIVRINFQTCMHIAYARI